jgi:hypothetical protein
MVGVTAVTLAVLASTIPVSAAAPRLVMIYGGSLSHPIILDDWNENLTLMLAASESAWLAGLDLGSRPSFQVAYFWGPTWADYMAAGKPIQAIRPEDASQHGRFYPAVGSARPLLTFEGSIRALSPEGVALLARHGVPTSFPAVRGAQIPGPVAALIAVVATLALLASSVIRSRRTRAP